MQLLGPLQMRGLILFFPQFAKVFYRLMTDNRVSIVAKAVPVMGVAAMLSPPMLELDFIPFIGELDWILMAIICLKVFLWLCPPDVVREHVSNVARGA
ncbi:MAG TPA: hypothetical protein VNF45_07615 [Candidatus Binataceae bacterium]|nr:hypothetical protein [Candidatus Binataceae bacterium]